MGDAQASNPIANWRVVNRVSDLPRSQLSCNAAGIPRAKRVAEGDALAGVPQLSEARSVLQKH